MKRNKQFSKGASGTGLSGRLAILTVMAVVIMLLSAAPASAGSLLTAPTGGETLRIGNTYNITWHYEGPIGLTNGVDLDLSTDSGATWTPIAHDVSTAIGSKPTPESYAWTVPNVLTSDARIRITVWYTTLGGSGLDPQAIINTGGTDESGDFRITHLIEIVVVLKAPTNLTATTASSSKINLAWSHDSLNETGYSIERKSGSGDFTEITETAANVNSYSDTGLTANTTYTYRVKALGNGDNVKSSDYSNEASAKTSNLIVIDPLIPLDPLFIELDAPAGLEAEAVSDSEINLDWTDESGAESGFSIERKEAGGSFEEIEQTAANTTSYSDSGLDADTKYTYRVKAIGNGLIILDSDYSNEDSATTEETPQNPQNPAQTVMRYYIGSLDYFVNDQAQSMDTAPIIKDGRTLLPIRYVATPLGAAVDWNAAEQKVTITMNGKIIELWINGSTARVNGVNTPIDPNNPNVTPIIVPPGRTMLPLRFIAENLGCQVDWNQALQEVKVTYPQN